MPDIFVDGDGCPVIDQVLKVAKETGQHVFLVCDTSHRLEREGAETIIVSKGRDAVDFYLVNRIKKGDIVVTQDYGLAAMVLARKGYSIDHNGRIFTDENIMRLLEFRHVAKRARMAGKGPKGPKKRKREDDLRFEQALRTISMDVLPS